MRHLYTLKLGLAKVKLYLCNPLSQLSSSSGVLLKQSLQCPLCHQNFISQTSSTLLLARYHLDSSVSSHSCKLWGWLSVSKKNKCQLLSLLRKCLLYLVLACFPKIVSQNIVFNLQCLLPALTLCCSCLQQYETLILAYSCSC